MSQVSSLNVLPLVSRVRRPAWPWVENREWGEPEIRRKSTTEYHIVPCLKNLPRIRKLGSPLLLRRELPPARGGEPMEFPSRRPAGGRETRLSAKPSRLVAIALDRAVGMMVKRTPWAVDKLAALAEGAESESVRLRALRTIFLDMMAVSKFSGIEIRMTEIERYIREQTGNAGHPG